MATKAKMTLGRGLILLAAFLGLAVTVRGQSTGPAVSAPPAGDAASTTPTATVPVNQRIAGDVYVEAVGTAFQDRTTMSPLLTDLEQAPFDEVLLRVREDGYAWYDSDLVPRPIGVSENFDPLNEAIGVLRTGARAKKVIAWFSPYRMAEGAVADATFPEGHVMSSDLVKGEPDALLAGDNGKVYLNPANPGIQARLVAVVTDLVSRYDIDGILIDLELPAVVEQPARWDRFDWDACAASVQGLVQAARKAKPDLIIGVADQGLGVAMTDISIDFRGRWLQTPGLNRLYSNCYVDDQPGAGRFDAGVADAVREAKSASVTPFIGVAGNINEAVNTLAQCKRAVTMGAEGIALADFNQPVLDAGARNLFFNALKSAVLGDGGLRVAARVDRTRFAEAVAASSVKATTSTATEESPTSGTSTATEEALTSGTSTAIEESPTSGTPTVTSGEEGAETVFEMPPPPEVASAGDTGTSGTAEGIAVPAVQDESSTAPAAVSDLNRALGNLTGIVDEGKPGGEKGVVTKSSQTILGELLRDPQFEQKREWKVLAPEVKAREQLKSTFPNIF